MIARWVRPTALLIGAAAAALGGVGVASAAGITLTGAKLVTSAPAVPPFYPTSLVTANGTRAGQLTGRVEQSDTLTLTLSDPVAAATLCSGATSNASASWGGISVQVAPTSGGNDVLTVTKSGATCTTLRLGSVDLGAAGFAPTAITYSGCNLALTQGASSATLVLTLGKGNATGTTVTAATVATWRPDATLTDQAGNAIGANTAVSAAGTQF